MRILELHTRVNVVSRTSRSATAAAAYIAREKLYDERTGLEHDYRHKGGVEFTALLAEENAPEWATDRARLWNEAERREKHPRAQTARSWQCSFPYEFTKAQREEAALKIMQIAIRRYGGAVDTAIHEPDEKGDHRNYHLHMLQTTRRFAESGAWAKAKDRVLDDLLDKGPKEVQAFREEIAGMMNEIATRERMDIYVEHLSFSARGIDKEPTKHLGWQATEMERRGMQTERGDGNREATARNEERRQLDERRKVIDFALAKEELRQKQGQPVRRETEEERFQQFYREAYDRRTVALQLFEQHHGQQQKDLRREVARLQGELGKGGFAGWWRGITGRTRADREQLEQATTALTRIRDRRTAMLDELERGRLQRLEAMRQAQERQAQEAAQRQALARAVGDTETRAGETPPANDDPKARRRGLFRLQAIGRKREQQPEPQAGTTVPEAPAIPAPPRTPETPTAQAFGKAADPQPIPDRGERRREFFRKRGQQRQRDRGPEHEL